MKKMFLFVLMGSILLLSGNAFALTINFATGQDSGGAIQTTGDSQDANWTATYTTTVPTYVTTSSNADWYGNWGDIVSSNSSWIAPYPDNAYGNGNYFYTYTFNLSGYNLATAVFSGMQFSQDDSGIVALNGNLLVSEGYIGGGAYYFTPFSVPASDLVNGINTLTVTQDGTDDYLEAMRFEGTLTVSFSPHSRRSSAFRPRPCRACGNKKAVREVGAIQRTAGAGLAMTLPSLSCFYDYQSNHRSIFVFQSLFDAPALDITRHTW